MTTRRKWAVTGVILGIVAWGGGIHLIEERLHGQRVVAFREKYGIGYLDAIYPSNDFERKTVDSMSGIVRAADAISDQSPKIGACVALAGGVLAVPWALFMLWQMILYMIRSAARSAHEGAAEGRHRSASRE